MKRLISRRGLNYLSAILPTLVAFSCMTQAAQGQSQPKLESPRSVDSSEVQESLTVNEELPPFLEMPDQGDELDSDIELFTSQGESVVIEPMSPEELQLAPRLEGPQANMPDEIIVVEPNQSLIPSAEQTFGLGDAQTVPELRLFPPDTSQLHPRSLPRPQLGVVGEVVRGWGFKIVDVIPGTAAARMQLERGDVILKINGQCVSSVNSIEQQLLRSVGEFSGQGVIKIDNVRGRTRCGASSTRFLWLKFQL